MRNISEKELGLVSGGTSEIIDFLFSGSGDNTASIIEQGRLRIGDNTYSISANTGGTGYDLAYTIVSETDENISHELSDQMMERLLGFQTFLPQENTIGSIVLNPDGTVTTSGQILASVDQFGLGSIVRAEPLAEVNSYSSVINAFADSPDMWEDLDGDGELSLTELDAQMYDAIAIINGQTITAAFATMAGTTTADLTYEDIAAQLEIIAKMADDDNFTLEHAGDMRALTYELDDLIGQAERNLERGTNLAQFATPDNGISDVAEIVSSITWLQNGVYIPDIEMEAALKILDIDPSILSGFDYHTPLLGTGGVFASLGIEAANDPAPEVTDFSSNLQTAQSLELPLAFLGMHPGQSITHSVDGVEFEITRTADLVYSAEDFGLDAETPLHATYTAQSDGVNYALTVALQGENSTPVALAIVA